ncbi:MAG: hypothetical protein M1835_000736 [Candelina submexicana]|nr:MAG: hypothetical protein M1835_000736 [Candelina submexicana]
MFGAILPSRPVQTNLQTLSATQFAFTLPAFPPFHHVVVFLLPGSVLPPSAAAAVYIRLPDNPDFKLLGSISNEKQSAIFKINHTGALQFSGVPAANEGDDAMIVEIVPHDATSAEETTRGEFTLGISVEPAASVTAQLENLKSTSVAESTTMVVAKRPLSTKMLAQKIIKNAFNFLASFADDQGGNEMVPLKGFRDWWMKFEKRIELDPEFLERDEEA